MARASRDSHRLIRWLWTSRRVDARAVRLVLLPLAALYRLAMRIRTFVYARGWLQVQDLPLPTVAVGNLTVGGSGKTPIATWIAQYYAAKGLVPGILLRGLRRRRRDPGPRTAGARRPTSSPIPTGWRGRNGPLPGAPRCSSSTTPISGSTCGGT